jgi:hypothetical protein
MPHRYRSRRSFYRRLNKCVFAIAVSLAWIGATGALAGLVFYLLKWLAGR